MKSVYVFLLANLLVASAMAQVNSRASLQPLPASEAMAIDAAPEGQPRGTTLPARAKSTGSTAFTPVVGYGVPIGFTFFDQPTLGSTPRRIDRFPDGTLGVAWTYARRQSLVGTSVGQMAGYNRRNPNGTWLYGGTSGYLPAADSLNFQVAGALATNNGLGTTSGFMADVNYLALANGTEVLGGYGRAIGSTFSHAQLYARTQSASSWPVIAPSDNGATLRAPFRMGRSFWAHAGNTVYLVGTTNDSTVVQGAPALGSTLPLVFARTTDNGTTWYTSVMPGVSTASGVNEVSSVHGFNIVARGSAVAVVAKYQKVYPNIGTAIVLFKSTDQGNTWRTSLLDHVDEADTLRIQRVSTTTSGLRIYAARTDDGCYGLTLDSLNQVHVTAARGWDLTDSLGQSRFYYHNGGFANPAAGQLRYWNESMGDEPFRIVGEFEDIDRNGDINLQRVLAPGKYRQGTASMSQIITDQNNPNHLYVVYSALVEETYQSLNDRHSRDLYIVASTDGGVHWTAPINIAGKIAKVGDAQTGGTTLIEESFPAAVPQIASDSLIHLTYLADGTPGAGDWLQNYTAATWKPSTLVYTNFKTTQVLNSVILANLPERAAAGDTLRIPYKLPADGSIPLGTNLLVQLDTLPLNILAQSHRFDASTTTTIGQGPAQASGTLVAVIPANWVLNRKARIRIVGQGLAATAPSAGPLSVHISSGGIAPLSAIRVKQALTVCAGQSNLLTAQSTNATRYNWAIQPATAGDISQEENAENGSALVWFNPEYRGAATISVTAENASGTSAPQTFVVNVTGPQVRAIPGTDSLEVFAGTGATYRWYYGLNFNQNLGNSRKIKTTLGAGTYTVVVDGGCRSAFNTVYSGHGTLFDPSQVVASVALEPSLTKASNLYPNPAKDRFVVELNDWTGTQAVRATVFNQLGQLVAEQQLTNENGLARAEFNTASFGRGLYVVRLVSGTQVATKRVVIE